MNAVEVFFSILSRQRLKHAIFNSLDESIAAIEGYIDHYRLMTPALSAGTRSPKIS
ncbi:MAG: hypothetical protein OXI81_09590 [Paracoccaceae bacterium]|nr:hypothetical protein [Paracoccaceae bacterium]MDE2912255.1 hypothetical protein [Paracoccaceae bacterium]